MCRFASFVLTRNNEYYLENSDSHEDIIENFKLVDDGNNIVRIELIPPKDTTKIHNISKWKFIIDQDKYPDWTYKNDPSLEAQAKKALQRRIEEQKIGYTIEKGIGENVHVGRFGTAIVGKKGFATSKDYGTSISGSFGISISGVKGIAKSEDCGTSIVFEYGEAITGNCGRSVSGLKGKSTTGHYGTAISGPEGLSIAGNFGKAIVGEFGKVQAGEYGELHIQRYENNECGFKTYVYYIGINGVKPNTLYRLENGQLVEAVTK